MGKPLIVPALSYAGLAGVAIGTGKLVATAGGTSALVFGMPLPLATIAAVALPAVFFIGEVALFGGGEHVAKMMGGKPADASLTAIANDIAARAGLPSPAYVYEIPSDELNAFAAGFGKGDTTVAVTSGLRKALNREELEAVLAHEIGHISHKDMSTNLHIAAAIAGLGGVYEIGKFLARTGGGESRSSSSSSSSRERKESDGASLATTGYVLMAGGAASRLIAQLMKLAFSRNNEFEADAVGAELVSPDAMISALQKIERSAASRKGGRGEASPLSARGSAFAHAYISSGEATDDGASATGGGKIAKKSSAQEMSPLEKAWKGGKAMLRTHPPTEDRIAALRASRIGESRA